MENGVKSGTKNSTQSGHSDKTSDMKRDALIC